MLKKDLIEGKLYILIEQQSDLKIGSIVKYHTYDIYEIIDGKWEKDTIESHECGNYFKTPIGYYISHVCLEEYEEKINLEIDGGEPCNEIRI